MLSNLCSQPCGKDLNILLCSIGYNYIHVKVLLAILSAIHCKSCGNKRNKVNDFMTLPCNIRSWSQMHFWYYLLKSFNTRAI